MATTHPLRMSAQIPASDLIPSAFGTSNKPEWIFTLRDIPLDSDPKKNNRKFYLTSRFEQGYRYYTINSEVRLSREFPEDYAREIGYKYGHGPGKTDEHGQPKLEHAKPDTIWMVRAWCVEDKRMVALIIDSYPLMGKIQKILTINDEFALSQETNVTNFYLTIFREPKQGTTKASTYDAAGSLRPTRSKELLEAAALPFFPDAYFKGLNPLVPPSDVIASGDHLPATVRDEHGADEEIALRSDDDGDW